RSPPRLLDTADGLDVLRAVGRVAGRTRPRRLRAGRARHPKPTTTRRRARPVVATLVLDDTIPLYGLSHPPAWHRQCAGDPVPRQQRRQLRASVVAVRSQFWKDLSLPFFGYNRPGAKVSEGVRESFWLQGMLAGFPAAYFCIRAFSETDQTEDLKKIDVPTLLLQGDDDQ